MLFEDVLCQLHDMLQPSKEGAYTLADLRRMRPQSPLLFNTLFNLHKFLAFENRDPFALRAESMGEDGQTTSEWDRCGPRPPLPAAVAANTCWHLRLLPTCVLALAPLLLRRCQMCYW